MKAMDIRTLESTRKVGNKRKVRTALCPQSFGNRTATRTCSRSFVIPFEHGLFTD